MEATMKNIGIECGADFVLSFLWADENGDPVDLTGAVIEAQLRHFAQDTECVIFTATHDGSGGKITLAMPHERTAQISYTAGVYDVYVNFPDGSREKALYGNAKIEPNVVKPVDGTVLYLIGISEYADLPMTGKIDRVYFVYEDRKIYRWNGTNYIATAVGNGIQRIDYVDGGTYRMVFDDGTYFDFESVPRLMGVHDSTAEYQKLDVVRAANGASYIALIPVPANTLITDTDYWMQLTPKGLGIGEVNSVGADSGASASISGPADDPVLNLNIPRGAAGNESIDDTAGTGDTDKVWSADKSSQYIERSGKNIFDKYSYSTRSTTNMTTTWTRTGMKLVTGAQSNRSITYILALKPNTTYTFSCKIDSENPVAWIGIRKASDATPTFPSGSTVIWSEANSADGNLNYQFKTNEYGYTRIIFYGTDSSATANTVVYSEIMLTEGTQTYYEPYENIFDYSGINSLPVSNNLLNINALEKGSTTFVYEKLSNGFRIHSDAENTYERMHLYIKLKPETTYTLKSTILSDPDQAVRGWIGYAESADEGATYPSSNTILTDGRETSEKVFTTKTGYLILRFFGNGSTAEAFDTSFINLSLEEKGVYEIEGENLLNIDLLKRSKSGYRYSRINNGFRLKAESAITYASAQIYLQLKPNTPYSLTGTIVKNQTQDMYGWVGYAESTDGGATYPSSNKILHTYANNSEPNQTFTFTTTTGYLRLRFFANASTSETCDTSFVDFELKEGPYIYDLPENVKAKSEIAALKLHRAPTTMAYPTQNPCNLLFFTDIHKNIIRAQRIKHLVNKWHKEYFDAVVFGGDMPGNIIQDDISWYYDALDGLAVPLLNVVGNHDTYWTNSGGTIEYADKSVTYGKLIEPIAEDSEIVQPEGVAETYDCYYYKDINSAVRIIAIDGMHWDADQKSWLRDVLADALTNDLHVICVNHCPFRTEYKQDVDCAWMKHPWRANPSYGTNIEMAEEVQTFMNNGGKFICWLLGHTHYDVVEILPEYGNQFCVTMGGDNVQQSHIMLNDDISTHTYDLLTYITVDTESQMVKFYRIGCGQECYGSIYKGLVIDYGNKTVYTSW